MREKASCACVVVQKRGPMKTPQAAERNDHRSHWLKTGVLSSLRYSRAIEALPVKEWPED